MCQRFEPTTTLGNTTLGKSARSELTRPGVYQSLGQQSNPKFAETTKRNRMAKELLGFVSKRLFARQSHVISSRLRETQGDKYEF